MVSDHRHLQLYVWGDEYGVEAVVLAHDAEEAAALLRDSGDWPLDVFGPRTYPLTEPRVIVP